MKLLRSMQKQHHWCSGNISAFQALASGSIPEWCNLKFFLILPPLFCPLFFFLLSQWQSEGGRGCECRVDKLVGSSGY